MKQNLKILIYMLSVIFLSISCKKESSDSPKEVSNLTQTKGDTTLTFTWIDPIDANFSKVEITYSEGTLVILKGVQTKVVYGLTNAKDYNFTIKTIDEKGNKSAGISVTASIDYRLKYIGDFRFTNKSDEWNMSGLPTQHDTLVGDGNIRLYGNTKIILTYPNSSRTVTLLPNGEILHEYIWTHGQQYGKFHTMDSLTFYYSNGGGGGGFHSVITGVRK